MSGSLFYMSLLQRTARGVAEMLGRESWLIQRIRPGYKSLLVWSSGPQGIPWVINGVTYRIDPRQYHQLALDHEARIAAFLRERVKPGAVCFDVGANVGAYVMQFANWCGPTGRVVAFEPNPCALEVLSKHVQWNGISDRVRIVPAAVGAAPGEAILYAADADGMSRLGAPNVLIADRVSPIQVPVITLDMYCETTGLRPDWLLIDVEGFEMAVLAGASSVIKSRVTDIGIIVEMHPNVWDSADMTREKAECLLADLGLEVISLTGQRDPLNDYGQVYLAYK
jgi:FkbM family methyltransferase